MEEYFLMVGIGMIVILILALCWIHNKEWIFNVLLRTLTGSMAIYCINTALAYYAVESSVGLNVLTIGVVGILGLPGLGALYALHFML